MPAPEFAEAMSTLASGVVLVTCRVGGRPWGLTVTAFTSVSADPPLVLVSLRSSTTSTDAIKASGRFGVSILAEGQEAVANHGSRPGAPKFYFVDRTSPSPVALAHLDCELHEAIDVADHTLLLRTRRFHARHPRGRGPRLPPPGYRTVSDPETTKEMRCLSS